MPRLHIFLFALLALALAPSAVLCAVLGIDFGQSSTKAALVSPGVPFEIVLTRDSKRKDVSGLAFKGDERLYGGSAAAIAPRVPATSFLNFKPLLGKSVDSDEAELYLSRHPGSTLIPAGNRSTVSFKTPDSSFPIEELLGMSFSHIKKLAEEMLPKDSATNSVYETSVTVPPYFTTVQRRAIIDAAEIGGLKVVSLVSDGVATAINYASSRTFTSEKQYHFIFDVGAGSTSATLVSFQEGKASGSMFGKSALNITVEGVGYDTALGGDLLDDRVYQLLLSKFVEAHGSGIESNPRALIRLRKEAERAKTILSANTEVRVSAESLYDDIDFRTILTRAEFEAAIEDLLPRIRKPFEAALAKAGADILDVNSVIIMGGSSRVPVFQQVLVKDVLKGDASKVSKNVNADEAAVLGATFRGVSVSKQFKTKDINIIEPVEDEFALTVKDAQGSVIGAQSLYPSGTIVSKNRTQTRLEIPEDANEAVLEFTEGSTTLFKYSLNDIQKSKETILAANNCSELYPVIESELSVSRTFDVHAVAWFCNVTIPTAEGDEGPESDDLKHKLLNFFNKSSKSEDSSSTTADASSSETATETSAEEAETSSSTATTSSKKPKPTLPPKPRTTKQPIKYKVTYLGPRNLGRATKTTSQSRLRAFDRLDSDRQAKETARNSLEAYAYRIREWIEYENVRFMEHSNEEERQAFLAMAMATLDWLYEEGESTVLETLKTRLDQLKQFENVVIAREKAKLSSLEEMLRPKTSSAEEEEAFTILPIDKDNLSASTTVMEEATASATDAEETPVETESGPEEHDEL
ncbi:Hsp70 protein-domain-containing protein [Myxozyma melibiosi]|uniref:Hsp70 protein-domain-containing protein n=1 Tax=Myxozyma melibiosi TaxID=54550 RepID=A0ABR1F422_9ASCO